jgi:hypothetical protein
MGGKGLSQSRGVEALEAGRSKGLMEVVWCVCVDEAVNQTRITDMCRVVGRSRVLLQWRWLGIGEGTRDESERHSEAQYTVLLVPCLQKGEVKCEGQPNGWNWVRRKGTLVV